MSWLPGSPIDRCHRWTRRETDRAAAAPRRADRAVPLADVWPTEGEARHRAELGNEVGGRSAKQCDTLWEILGVHVCVVLIGES